MAKRYFLYDVLNDYSIEKVSGKSDFGTLAHAKRRAVKDNRGKKVLWRKMDIPGLEKWDSYYGRNEHNELINIISTHGLIKNPIGKTATTTDVRNGNVAVKYHDTYVVSYNPNSRVVVLDSGGWKTATTKRRMNEASQEFHLGYHVYAKKKVWYIDTPYDGTIEFHDGIQFQGKRTSNPKRKRKVAKKRRTAKQRAATRKLIAYNKKRGKKKRKTARRKVRASNPRKKRTALKKSHLWIVFRCWGESVHFLGVTASGTFRYRWIRDKGKAIVFRTTKEAQNVANSLSKKRPNFKYHVGVISDHVTAAKIKSYCKGKA